MIAAIFMAAMAALGQTAESVGTTQRKLPESDVISKDGLRSPAVPAVDAFRKLIVEAEK